MDPTMNDVLSGRGAWFNQHPGNKHFRRMLEEKKDVYMTGTKKQKMNISKAIVEAIYSKDPPGRFLKKCPERGDWKELSKRDAADRAAQAMAYVIKGKSLKEKRRHRRLHLPPPSQSHNEDGSGRKLLHSVDRPTRLEQNTEGNHSSSATNHEIATGSEGARGTWDSVQCATDLLRLPGNSNLQQQIFLQQLQQSSTAVTSVDKTSIDQSVDQNGLAQPQQLVQTLQQQQQQQQQFPRQLQYTLVPPNNSLGQFLQSQTTLQPALYEGMAHHQLNQAQQQVQHQHQLLLQRLLNQQNVNPSASPLVAISTSAQVFSGHLANNNIFVQNVQQQSNTPSSNAISLDASRNTSNQPSSNSNNAGICNTPQLRSIMLQHQNHLPVSTSGSPNQLPSFRQQQLQPALQADLFLRNSQYLPSINYADAGTTSTNVVAQSTRQAENDDVNRAGRAR